MDFPFVSRNYSMPLYYTSLHYSILARNMIILVMMCLPNPLELISVLKLVYLAILINCCHKNVNFSSNIFRFKQQQKTITIN